MKTDFLGRELIDVYSRKQAIADGVQFQIPENLRKEAGFNFPIFVTQKVYQKYLTPPKHEDFTEQSFTGRTWDLLSVLYYKAIHCASNSIQIKVLFRMPDNGDWENNETFFKEQQTVNKTLRIVTLHSLIGPLDFDNPAPAITISHPNED